MAVALAGSRCLAGATCCRPTFVPAEQHLWPVYQHDFARRLHMACKQPYRQNFSSKPISRLDGGGLSNVQAQHATKGTKRTMPLNFVQGSVLLE